MRRGTAVAALSMALAAAYAHGSPSQARFGADAFNRVVSAAAGGNTVFSPHSFEIDCAVFACAFDAIVKARYAEQLGAMKGIEQIYGPLHGHVRSLAATNRFSLKSARAMCLPDVRLAHLAYRRDIQDLFGAEVCMARAAAGVENWLRASMDGAMEDFSLPDAPAEAGRYSFYDLTDVRLSWRDPFPTGNTRRIPFRREDGSAVEVDAMCDLRPVEAWECRRFTLVRLPLADGAWFYAMLPSAGTKISGIRAELSSARIDDLLAASGPMSQKSASRAPAAIVVPKMDITSTLDLSGAFSYFRLPVRGFARMDGSLRHSAIVQRVRFRLDEQGLDPEPLEKKPEEAEVRAGPGAKRFVLNRPFVFFVYHEPTGTMPVAGQFTGI